MHTNADDARTVVAQLLYLLTHSGPTDGEVDVPLALRDLGPVELTPEGVAARLETMVAGACRAVLAVVDVAAPGQDPRGVLQQAALLLADADVE